MPILRNRPIDQKLLIVVLVITGTALLLSGIAIIVADSVLYRISMRHDVTTLANIIGDNSTAALEFDDPRVAAQTLGALRARPHLVAACTYKQDGTLFATYPGNGAAASECPAPAAGEELKFAGGGVQVSHPILMNGRRVGTLAMFFDTSGVAERTRLYGAIVLVILVFASLFAIGFSARLRETIAGPIVRLADAAAHISQGDYSVRVVKDAEDETGALVAAFNQMVTRVQARELEIENARNSLQTTLLSIGDAVISTDREGTIVFANPVAGKLLGRREPEILGRPIHEVFRIVNEFTRQPLDNPIDRVLREGRTVGLANPAILIAADGVETPIDDSAAPIQLNGRTAGAVLVFRDISERRKAQQDSAFLAAMIESTDDAVVGKSPEGIIRSWNAGAERLYGYQAEEVIGRPMADLLPPERRHEESDILERLRSGSPVYRSETVRQRKDGTLIDVELTISPIRDKSGEIIGVSHIAHDISEQKRTAEQMRQTQKLESLGILAGGIAHDFNNLLTGILGNASLALEDVPSDSPARMPIESVVEAGERAALLAGQMLAYSGKGHFVLEHINLAQRIREILPLIKASIPSHVELVLQLRNSLPAIEADAAQMQQLLMNIIINGAEAIPENRRGSVTITTSRYEVSPNGGGAASEGDLAAGEYVLLEVTDTGSGMDEATRARIFDPFFTTKFTGRGLGLAAVLGIVRGHHGNIEVASKPGEGTTFRILLPAAEETSDNEVESRIPTGADHRGSGVILVVDDEHVVRAMARQTLERYGYTVLLAEDGAQGVETYRREAGNLKCVILDLTMPAMGGEEALARMKAADPDVPIILSSGFNEAQALRRFEGKGLSGFLQKPYRAPVLLETVLRVISRTARGMGG